ncbi:phytanoyl-CoA dioxygenase family protein [Aulographum hederae CBS 113979]|uniref:Phytanoyl-CoA dioxygenase family protein n=1 Tax=Aulographum hederae CBS 113979 TaxID=1176131 RepID=A0A6G1GYR1_9PEZI|nr:phytanoyl-CoA dioxygenase family protein [Aulographum hederae CBS 113979]
MPHANEVPELQRIDFNDTRAIIEAIKKDGGVIAENYTSLEDLEKVNNDTRPYLDADRPWKGLLFPPETRRCSKLVGRSETAREKWMVDQRLTNVLNYFLCKTTKNWYSQKQFTYTTYPVLSISITMDVRAGAKGQRLHRDDKNYHTDHKDQTATGYQRESDVEMAVLVPGCETTVENGATLVIPGSHLWNDTRTPQYTETTHATMLPGSALIFLGSLYHAGGTNSTNLPSSTSPPQNRPMHGLFFNRGTVRTEENQYIAYPPSVINTWSRDAKIRAGFNCSNPNVGMVEFMTPMDYLEGRDIDKDFESWDLDAADAQLRETMVYDF